MEKVGQSVIWYQSFILSGDDISNSNVIYQVLIINCRQWFAYKRWKSVLIFLSYDGKDIHIGTHWIDSRPTNRHINSAHKLCLYQQLEYDLLFWSNYGIPHGHQILSLHSFLLKARTESFLKKVLSKLILI